jgi:hypothetical protein
VQAEVERRIAAGEIVSAAQVKKMKQQAAPTGEWTGGCPSRTPRASRRAGHALSKSCRPLFVGALYPPSSSSNHGGELTATHAVLESFLSRCARSLRK